MLEKLNEDADDEEEPPPPSNNVDGMIDSDDEKGPRERLQEWWFIWFLADVRVKSFFL